MPRVRFIKEWQRPDGLGGFKTVEPGSVGLYTRALADEIIAGGYGFELQQVEVTKTTTKTTPTGLLDEKGNEIVKVEQEEYTEVEEQEIKPKRRGTRRRSNLDK